MCITSLQSVTVSPENSAIEVEYMVSGITLPCLKCVVLYIKVCLNIYQFDLIYIK